MSNRCVIVIPAYKEILEAEEIASLRRVVDVLGSYRIVIVHPVGMSLFGYQPFVKVTDTIALDKYYFRDRRTYSELLEDALFYGLFAGYEYMLIYQLDAWVFSDRLEEFMNLGYDYIGAPHCSWENGYPIVGNGGLSLRKIQAFADVCRRFWIKKEFHWAEDRAFTECAPSARLRIAPVDVAYRFSIQDYFEEGMRSNGGELPFGSHQGRRFWPDPDKYFKID